MGSELEEGEQGDQGEQEQHESVEEAQEGGKRKRKKGKAGKWIMHVKAFAKSHKIKFRDALKHPDCKKSYKKM